MPNKRTGPDYLDKSAEKYRKAQKKKDKKHQEAINKWQSQ